MRAQEQAHGGSAVSRYSGRALSVALKGLRLSLGQKFLAHDFAGIECLERSELSGAAPTLDVYGSVLMDVSVRMRAR